MSDPATVATAKQPSEGHPPSEGMVWIPGGTFLMGSDRHYPEEAPAHRVSVDGFWMDAHTVTNAEFRQFVERRGFKFLLGETNLRNVQFGDFGRRRNNRRISRSCRRQRLCELRLRNLIRNFKAVNALN